MEIANLLRTPGTTETHVIVPSVRVVPEAAGSTHEMRSVVPRASTQPSKLTGIGPRRISGWRLAVIA